MDILYKHNPQVVSNNCTAGQVRMEIMMEGEGFVIYIQYNYINEDLCRLQALSE